LEDIARYFSGSQEKHFVRYAFCALFATNQYSQLAASKVYDSDDIELRRLATFLGRIGRAEADSERRLVRQYARTRLLGPPFRHEVEPRALPLLQIAERQGDRDLVFLRSSIEHLRAVPPDLRDHVTESFLERLLEVD
jgi:hypothetical protein